MAEESNFTRAASRLGIGQPPLSQQIRDLEAEVGVALFHRVPHGAELTAAGTAFLVEARLALAAAERAKFVAQQASRGETGTLILGLTASSAFNTDVSSAIRTFRDNWPDVRLTLIESNTRVLLERLSRGEVDAAFIRPGPEEPPKVRLKRLVDEPLVVALPAKHRLADSESVAMPSLANEPFVMFPRTAGLSLFDDIAQACRDAGFELMVVQEAAQLPSVVNLVAAGLGVSIIPQSISQIDLPGVVYRPISDRPINARLALAWMSSNRSPVLSNFAKVVEG